MVNLSRVKRLTNPATVACRYHLVSDRGLQLDYKVSSEVLGQGLCGDVIVAHGRKDGRRYAVKTLRKSGVAESKLHQLISEVEIHLAMDHPNIVRVKDVYESETSISMVTECCEGGELYASLQDRGTCGDAESAEVTRQMLRVVRHLHARRIVHRDIKLENFLFQDAKPLELMDKFLGAAQENNRHGGHAEAPQLKLIDFGFAKVWDGSRLMKTACGSAEYVSPDVLLNEGYTSKTDLWSLGVIVWMLLSGYPPFHGAKQSMMAKIKAAKPDWSHQSRWRDVSQDAKDFVQQLLIKDPLARIDAETALQHPWLTQSSSKVQPSLAWGNPVWSMQRYAAGSKVRRAALQMLVQQLDWQETRKFRVAFLSMDKNSEGWISAVDFADLIEQMRDPEWTSNDCRIQQVQVENPGALFAALDVNKDQRIYYSEFLAATAKVCRFSHKQALKATFSRFDADGSGSIGTQDLLSVLGKTFEGADVEELLEEARPQGGEISFEEFVEAIMLGDSAETVQVISPTKDSPKKGDCKGPEGPLARFGLLSSISAL